LISTDCPNGPREILDGGKYGQLVPVGVPQAMAAAMTQALIKNNSIPPPKTWLQQFELDVVLDQYTHLLFGESEV